MKAGDKIIWTNDIGLWHKGKIVKMGRGIFTVESDGIGVFNPILNILQRERYVNLSSLDENIKRITSL